MTALARPKSNRTSKLQTNPLVREGAPHKKKTQLSDSKESGNELQMGPRHQDSLTVGRNLTSALERSDRGTDNWRT
jgi:hypothetical protein